MHAMRRAATPTDPSPRVRHAAGVRAYPPVPCGAWAAGFQGTPKGDRVEKHEAIAAAIRRSGLSQAEIARRIGSSPQYICDLLHGRASAGPDRLRRLAAVLGPIAWSEKIEA